MNDKEIDEIVNRLNYRMDRRFKGVLDVLNSLSERLTGDQFTVMEGPLGDIDTFIPELRRVWWHPVKAQGESDAPFPCHANPTENRSPEPCVIRRSMYEMKSGIGWEVDELGQRLKASH
mgnify:CR=1 FL=1